MLGGRRSSKTRRQRGGAYSIGQPDGTVNGFPGASGIAGIVNTGCSAPSQTAIPTPTSADTLNSRSSYLWTSLQKGGAPLIGSDLSAASAPLAGPAATGASITVPTAGLTHLTGDNSIGLTSAGTKFMINIPADGRVAACMAGGTRKNKTSKKSKMSKKSKTSKKSKMSKKSKASKSSRN
jgi:hypothetical protein